MKDNAWSYFLWSAKSEHGCVVCLHTHARHTLIKPASILAVLLLMSSNVSQPWLRSHRVLQRDAILSTQPGPCGHARRSLACGCPMNVYVSDWWWGLCPGVAEPEALVRKGGIWRGSHLAWCRCEWPDRQSAH